MNSRFHCNHNLRLKMFCWHSVNMTKPLKPFAKPVPCRIQDFQWITIMNVHLILCSSIWLARRDAFRF